MNNEQNSQQPVILHEQRQSKGRKGKKFGTVILVLLLLIGTGAGIYYWQQQEAEKLHRTNQELINKIAQNADNNNPENVPKETVYKAEVGKFTLSIPDKFVVIKINDGGGEGGPATVLEIGERTDAEGVLSTQLFKTVTLTAYPLDQRDSFREVVESKLTDKLPEKQPSVVIDGVEAEVYFTEGFAKPKMVFFTKNNIFYEISMDDTNESTVAQLEAIVKGLKFN